MQGTSGLTKTTEQLNRERQLRKLMRVVNELKRIDPDMTLNCATAFIETALNEGISVSDLAAKSGQQTPTVSRIVGQLGDYSRTKTPAYQVVKESVSPVDRRVKEIRLTPKGSRVIGLMVEALTKE